MTILEGAIISDAWTTMTSELRSKYVSAEVTLDDFEQDLVDRGIDPGIAAEIRTGLDESSFFEKMIEEAGTPGNAASEAFGLVSAGITSEFVKDQIENAQTVSHGGSTYNHYSYGLTDILVDTDITVISDAVI